MKHKKAAVVGTTGHTPEQKKEIEKISREIPLVMAPNMSVGVNVMWKIIGQAARVLGNDFKVCVTEVHHIHKKDRPSGTALQIAHVLSDALGVDPAGIPIESIREGEVVGEFNLKDTSIACMAAKHAGGNFKGGRNILSTPAGLHCRALPYSKE